MTWQGSTFLKHAIQFAAFSSSMYIGFCNVSDYHHYPTDAVAGLLEGVTFAILTVSDYLLKISEKLSIYY